MDPQDTVVVTGTGRASAPPDAIVVDLQLEGHGPTVGQALSALTAATRACQEALPGRRVTTHGLGLHPRHDHQGRQVGHTAYQSLQVRTDDPQQVGVLVGELAEAVGTGLGVNGLRPEISDPTEPARTARARAVEDARAKAEHYAQLAERALGPVLWVREGGGKPIRPREGADARMAMASAGPAVDPADQEVLAVVEIGWALRPDR